MDAHCTVNGVKVLKLWYYIPRKRFKGMHTTSAEFYGFDWRHRLFWRSTGGSLLK
jgi:hypothetical protein